MAVGWGSGYVVPPVGVTERPPVPDWYSPFETRKDLGVSFFELVGLAIEEPNTEWAQLWALMWRSVNARLQNLARHYQK